MTASTPLQRPLALVTERARELACACAAAALGASACTGELDVTSGNDAGGGGVVELPYEPCPVATGVGEFAIELSDDYTTVRGKVFDGVAPSLIAETLAQQGECQLLRIPARSCDPPCPVSTQACSSEGQCVALPAARDVGRVTLSGLVVPVEMNANAVTGSYRPQGAALPHPGFEPGADLRLHASGGVIAGFELRGWGISVLELATSPIHVEAGAATDLEWTAHPGPTRLQVRLHLNNHGSSSAWIECDLPDTGAASIPARLIDALLANGRSGFPTIELTRRTANSTSTELGCVQMLVTSEVSAGVSLAGLTSCNDSSMCPAGQTCRALERFCE